MFKIMSMYLQSAWKMRQNEYKQTIFGSLDRKKPVQYISINKTYILSIEYVLNF